MWADGSAYWKSVWEAKDASNVSAASGRTGYTADQVQALVGDAVTALGVTREDSLVDVGCAAGLMGEHIAGRVRDYLGVDYSANAIKEFARRVPGVRVRVASATMLPASDREFTCGLLSSVLLCLTEEEGLSALRELRRVVSGRAFVSGNLDASREAQCPIPGAYTRATWYWPEQLQRMARDAGWTSAGVLQPSPLIPQSFYQFDMILR